MCPFSREEKRLDEAKQLSSACQVLSLDLLTRTPAARPVLPQLQPVFVPAGLEGWGGVWLGQSPHLFEPHFLICKAGVAVVPTSEGWGEAEWEGAGPGAQNQLRMGVRNLQRARSLTAHNHTFCIYKMKMAGAQQVGSTRPGLKSLLLLLFK